MSYSEDFKIFVATIYGEAVGCSEISWKVIAHSIQNRIGFGAWKKWSTTTEIISKTGYDAYKAKTTNYKYAKTQLNDGVIKSSELKKLIAAVEPIFHGLEKDFTGGVVSYYSPKAQASLHKSKPDQYASEW